MTTPEEVLKLIEQDEGLTLEFKDSRILRNSFKLARIMTAFANAEGGVLLIGIKDDGSIEGMRTKKGHEEYVMNVSIDKCVPPLAPIFNRVSIAENDVYVVTVPKRKGPYHAVKTRDGYKFFTRVGSRIREVSPEELSQVRDEGVEVEPQIPIERFAFWLGKKFLLKTYGRLDANLSIVFVAMIITGTVSIVLALYLMFGMEDGKIIVKIGGYPSQIYYIITFLLVGFFITPLPIPILKTRCPVCKSYFSYRTIRKWVLGKRTVKEGLEEWKVRNIYRCDICGYKEEKRKFEQVSIE